MKRILIGIIQCGALRASVGTVPLVIQEAIYPGITGLARTSEPVTVGVPLADAAGITSTGSNVTLSGAAAGQFRCLGTWPDGYCKWMLVDTLASIASAGAINTAIAVTDCTSSCGNFGGSNLGSDSNSGNPNSGTITITTGTATFTIKKANFNLIDTASVGATAIMNTGTSQGLVVMGPANPGTTCGTCATAFMSSNDSVSTAVLEENGPVRATIKAMGALRDGGGNVYMRFTARLSFYKNKSYVRFKVELRNADENTSSFASAYKGFASYEARFGTTLAASTSNSWAFGGRSSTVSGNFATTSDTAYIYQAYSNNLEFGDWNSGNLPANTFYTLIPRSSGGGCTDTWCYPNNSRSDEGYRIVDNGANQETGTRFQYPAGWADLANSSGTGIMAGISYMSAYWPKSIELQAGGSRLVVGLYPSENPHGYNQAWPQYTINEFQLEFHASALASAVNDFNNYQYNLVARAAGYPCATTATCNTAAAWYYNMAQVFPYQFPSADEEDAYYTRVGTNANPALPGGVGSQCCVSDFEPSVFHYYAWPNVGGGNQSDLRWGYQLNFIFRGFIGRYLWAKNFYRFIAESALARSDFSGGWRGHLPQSDLNAEGFPGNVTPANWALGGLVDWIETSGEHTHIYGIFDWYYATGDESLKDAITQGMYDRYLNPTVTDNTGVLLWNSRAIGAQLMTEARLHDYLVSLGDSTNAAAAYSVAETILNYSVRPTVTSPGFVVNQIGTDKNRGFQYGCCSFVSWDNPPATDGPNGAGTGRAAGTFQHAILIEGLYEYLHSRGTSWPGYNDLADLGYGMYSWIRDEMTVPTTSWSPTQGAGGLRYYVEVDYCNAMPLCVSSGNALAGMQTNFETVWQQYYYDAWYTGDTSWSNFFAVLLNGNAASSGTNWTENGLYNVSSVVYRVLHPATVQTLRDVPFSFTNNGGGTYTLTFTPPKGTTALRIKWGTKTLVASLGFDPMMSNSYALNPSTYQTWWSATNANNPAPTPGISQDFICNASNGCSGAGNSLTAANFSVKAYVPNNVPVWTEYLPGIGGNGPPAFAGWNTPFWDPYAGAIGIYALRNTGQSTIYSTDISYADLSNPTPVWSLQPGGTGSITDATACATTDGSWPRDRHPYGNTSIDTYRGTMLILGGSACGGFNDMGVEALHSYISSNTWSFFIPGGGTYPDTTQENSTSYNSDYDVWVTVGANGGGWTKTWIYCNTRPVGGGAPTGIVTAKQAASGRCSSADTWINISPTAQPPNGTEISGAVGLYTPTTVYDPDIQKTLLYGGIANNGPISNQLWAFDLLTNTWKELCKSTGCTPPPVQTSGPSSFESFVYDKNRQGAWLHIPSSASGVLDYFYNPATDQWINLGANGGATDGANTVMGYDPVHDRLLTYGLKTPGTAYADIWASQALLGPGISNQYPLMKSLPTGHVGTAYSTTLTATGGSPPYTWTVASGATLPPGMSLNSSTGVVSGTPTTGGRYAFSVLATDGNGLAASLPALLQISGCSISTSWPSNSTYTNTQTPPTLTATALNCGGGTLTWSSSGLPSALSGCNSVNGSSCNITGTLSMTGTFTPTISVSDGGSNSANANLTVIINPVPTISTTCPLPSGTSGVVYSDMLTVTGGTPAMIWGLSSGSLPAGIGLAAVSGVISGTPTGFGSTSFMLVVTDANSVQSAGLSCSLTINPSVSAGPPFISGGRFSGGIIR